MNHQLNDYVPVRDGGKLVVGLSPVRQVLYGVPYRGHSGHIGRIRTENAESTRVLDNGFVYAENFFVPIDPYSPAKVECEGGNTETDAKWHEHYAWDPRNQSWAVTSLSVGRERELNQLAIIDSKEKENGC